MELPQRLAKRQEKEDVDVYGGRLVPQSGSGTSKGDVETDDELIECKHTERKSYSLKLDDLVTHWQHAVVAGKRAVFEVEFTLPNGRNRVPVVVLDRNEYIAMRDELAELREMAERYPDNCGCI